MACTSALWAQKVVTGTITDASTKEALIGASVVVKGTSIGAATDIDGKYRLENVKDGAVLQISYIGMETVEEVVGDRTVVDVALGSNSLNLNEVVVTAMGIERKAKSLTYATQKVKGAELVRAKETNMINSLQGKAAGVVITPNSSGAGGSSKIVIRGNKSAQGNNQALIVIDGVPMSNNSMSQV
ncbi:MAG: carboxypeptidase-like regulatory domain-containing protein, partial [Muribaculaceae bacterium]